MVLIIGGRKHSSRRPEKSHAASVDKRSRIQVTKRERGPEVHRHRQDANNVRARLVRARTSGRLAYVPPVLSHVLCGRLERFVDVARRDHASEPLHMVLRDAHALLSHLPVRYAHLGGTRHCCLARVRGACSTATDRRHGHFKHSRPRRRRRRRRRSSPIQQCLFTVPVDYIRVRQNLAALEFARHCALS